MWPSINDCRIKGPKARYGEDIIMIEVSMGKVEVQQFVFEHAEIFWTFMMDCWMTRLTISGTKLAVRMKGIKSIGFLCDKEGRQPYLKKVAKILDWLAPRDMREVREARGFVGIVVYYHILFSNS